MPIAYAAPLAAALVTLLLIAWMLKAGARLPLDRPNERSLHNRPVPRSGGLAIMAGIFAGFAIIGIPLPIVLPAAMLVVVSHLDDLRGLPIAVRFGAQFAAAVWLVAVMLPALPLPLLILIIVGIVWITNLYNFMDGADGLAGGMAIVGFGTYGLAAWLGGNRELELLAWSIAAAGAGFLIFNFPLAKIFMGDVGSIPLGFLAGAFGVAGWQQGLWPLWFPLVVFAPFIVDASMTLTRRLLRGERIWEAHREHYYQRLILCGWSHRKTALWEYALMLACAALALAVREAAVTMQAAAVVVAIATCGGCAVWIDRRWKRFSAEAHG